MHAVPRREQFGMAGIIGRVQVIVIAVIGDLDPVPSRAAHRLSIFTGCRVIAHQALRRCDERHQYTVDELDDQLVIDRVAGNH